MSKPRPSKKNLKPRKRASWEPPLSYEEVRREFVVVWNEKRQRKDWTLPSTNEVLYRTGGSKRDVNRFMKEIRGDFDDPDQPKRSRTFRRGSTRSTTGRSGLTVIGGDRRTTSGVTDEDLDALRRTTASRKTTKRWKDPSK